MSNPADERPLAFGRHPADTGPPDVPDPGEDIDEADAEERLDLAPEEQPNQHDPEQARILRGEGPGPG